MLNALRQIYLSVVRREVCRTTVLSCHTALRVTAVQLIILELFAKHLRATRYYISRTHLKMATS